MLAALQVLEDQVTKPVKEVKKRGYKPSGKDRPLDTEDDQARRTELDPLLWARQKRNMPLERR